MPTWSCGYSPAYYIARAVERRHWVKHYRQKYPEMNARKLEEVVRRRMRRL